MPSAAGGRAGERGPRYGERESALESEIPPGGAKSGRGKRGSALGSVIPPGGLLRDAAPPAVVFLLSARLLPARQRRESNERVEAKVADAAIWAKVTEAVIWADVTEAAGATDVADVPFAAAHVGDPCPCRRDRER